ncbi:MAG: PAS domain S-box protein, partial [Chloroflexota bacterium]
TNWSDRFINADRFPQVMAQDNDEAVIGAVAVNRDITALRRSEAQFRDLFEFAPISMVIIRLDGQFLQANQAACDTLGYTRDELYQLTFFDITHPDDLAQSQQLAKQLADGEINEFKIEKRYIKKDQSTVYVLAQAFLLRDVRGQPQRFISQLIDLTDRKQTEDALRQTQKLESLGVLAGGIAHDFNNLLTVMLAQSSLIEMKLPPDSPVLSNVAQIVQASERATDLTQQMLAYSGRGRFEIQPIQINALIQENMHLLKVALPKRVHLVAELADTLPLIDGDVGQVQQVIMNLIINAAEAVEDQTGNVTITTRLSRVEENNHPYFLYTHATLRPGSYVIIQVKDDGVGLADDVMERIFDPFFTTKTTGRGLGLAAVLGIVRGHQGGLEVESEIGVGTTFRIFLPISDHTSLPPDKSPALLPEHKRNTASTVLIIDDEEAILHTLTTILQAEGVRTIRATDGREGIKLYQQDQTEIGLVILDLSMPGLSGEETLKQLKQVNPDVSVLISSGYSEIEILPRFIDQDVVGFLQKPYQAQKLLERVQRYL